MVCGAQKLSYEELINIDDDWIEDGSIFEKVKAENFAHGLPIFYAESEGSEYYTVEYKDGSKLRVHVDELEHYAGPPNPSDC